MGAWVCLLYTSKLYDDRDYAKLPDEIKKKVDETVTKMKNGEIEIPSDVE